MTMRSLGRVTFVILATTIGVGAPPAVAGSQQKVAVLTGSQENPPVVTTAAGCARINVDTVANKVVYHIAFSGLAETAAHLHGPAAAGANAGVVHTLPAGNPKVGSWTYPEAMESDILAGRIYINIHTAAHPGGELRGQIVDMLAIIDGGQENPPAASGGSGVGLFQLDTLANTLDYHVIYGGLGAAETAAHIHGFALHGANAGVKHTLPAANPKVGTWTYAEADEQGILDGRTYVNIHTSAFPGGEIRGQVTRYVNPLDGTQATPPVGSPGHGCGLVSIDRATDTLSYRLTHQDMTGPATAAHIHGYVAPGAGTAGVQHNIGVGNPAIGVWDYPTDREADILDAQTYFNVHTAANPGGEVRSHLRFAAIPCPTDIDCNGTVGFGDLLVVLSNWGPTENCPPYLPADLNEDCEVAFDDLLTVLSSWGDCP